MPVRLRKSMVALVTFVGFSGPMGASAGESAESLLDIYRQAEQADPELRGLYLEYEALLEDRRAALGALLPSAQISAEIRYTDRDEERAQLEEMGSETEFSRTFTQKQYMLNVSQPLFDLPAWHQWQGSQRSADAGEAELEARRQDLIHGVAEAYLGVLDAQTNVELQERELEAVQASLRQAEALHEAREIATSEYEQAQARYDNVRAALIRAEGELEVAHEQLAELTDRRHYNLATLRSDAELPPLDPPELDIWLEHAFAGNPELIAARAELAAEGRQARAASAQRYPTVDLVGGYTRFDDAAEVDMDAADPAERNARQLDDLYIGVQVQMPLFEGGAINARTRAANHRHDRQREQVEQVRRGVRSEARSAFQGILSGRSQIEAYQVAVRSGERTVQAMQDEVEAGTRDITDLLEAQRELFESRRNLAEARHQYLLDTLKLRRAAGHLSGEDILSLDQLFRSG
ncbi:TolC family outer membrane protein [Halorhodospira halochloris]|uniref:TolC family outer membrane protein n=1 Tax=Halorhodospira halochloris TaxID=1052 RepID=UPI001EE8096B|nr:TolC family outer membrane protein [Halorhodospira halochloris]MCG5529698.1 TolC family outer membrane protein [Halorhodospira halochloris]